MSQLFNTLNYCSFDEPELEQFTPDLFLVSKEEADSITCQSNLSDAQTYTFNHALFIELKAYHSSTMCAERGIIASI